MGQDLNGLIVMLAAGLSIMVLAGVGLLVWLLVRKRGRVIHRRTACFKIGSARSPSNLVVAFWNNLETSAAVARVERKLDAR